MSASDVLGALRDLEFDDFLPTVEAALGAFREAEKVRAAHRPSHKIVSFFQFCHLLPG